MKNFYIISILFLVCLKHADLQNSTYKFFSSLKNWYEARVACIKAGGHLAIINTEEERQAIIDFLKFQPGQTVWIHMGFHIIFDTDVVDLFGKRLTWQDWNAGEPSSRLRDEKCGSIYNALVTLNDYNCDAAVSYLCEFPNEIVRNKNDDIIDPFYIINKQPLTWPQARRHCQNQNGHLVIFDREGELQRVLEDVVHENIPWFWVGYHNMFNSEEIVLENGDLPQNQYVNWTIPCKKQQKYGLMHYTGKPKLADPEALYPSVCEINKPNCHLEQ